MSADFKCDKCQDTGLVDVDMGGGNERQEYCKCDAGDELRQRHDQLYDQHINDGIDRMMDKRRGV
jgi:hypothetical protein